MIWNFFNRKNKEIIKRLNESISECEKAIETYKKSNLVEEELQERWTLNELKYIKTGNFTEYINEKSTLSRELIHSKYNVKED